MLKRCRKAASLAGAILVALSASPVSAEPVQTPEATPQVAPAEPQARTPQPPPGIFVLPRQPQAAPQPPADPQGCTYRENKLELLV